MSSRCAGRALGVLVLGAIAIVAAPGPASAGPGEAGRGRRAAKSGGEDLAGADYVVLAWFRGDDALRTFRYQTYDARKGEYDEAVADWVRLIRERYPRYVVRVQPVHLDREQGATEKLKVGSVIHRELLLAAARSGVVVGAPISIGPGPSATPHPSPRIDLRLERPGAGGTIGINPVGPSMPFPYPYPRPHP